MLDYCQIVHRCISFTKIIVYKNLSYVNKISSVHLALNLIGVLHTLGLNLMEVRISPYLHSSKIQVTKRLENPI